MGRRKRSELGLPAVIQPESVEDARTEAPLRWDELPHQQRYMTCPVCKRYVRPGVVADGPYAAEARMQGWGGRGRIAWGEPKALTPAEQEMLRARLQRALDAIGE